MNGDDKNMSWKKVTKLTDDPTRKLDVLYCCIECLSGTQDIFSNFCSTICRDNWFTKHEKEPICNKKNIY